MANQCLHADVSAEFGAGIARFLGKHLSGLFGSLMHEIDPENAHYCKRKTTFACRRFCRIWSCNCKVLQATISLNAWLSFARNISDNCTLLQRQNNVCMQTYYCRICSCSCKIIK